MVENGVKLQPEADKFTDIAGMLTHHLTAPNSDASTLHAFSNKANCLLAALCKTMLENLHKRGAVPYSEKQKSINYTVSYLRKACLSFQKKMYGNIRKRVWRG